MLLLSELHAAANTRPTPNGAPMTNTSNNLFMTIAIICSVFMLKTAHAEQAPGTASSPDHFIIQLPVVDREMLVEQVEKLRSQLIQRKQVLEQIVADNKLDSSDAIITVFMPGGLLYAGYKKVRFEQAKNELDNISADIEEFSSDLLAMQPMPMQMAVAQLP
jgi:pyruvate/oxaloacetate carboxyltransferase